MRVIRIGTRRSGLAMAQSRLVADAIVARRPGWRVEPAPIETRGDRTFGPLTAAGGKGLFTAELEVQLRAGSLELAVHSAKDMPAAMGDDLCIAAVPPRGDARDALLSRHAGIDALPPGAKVGTGSPRRAALLKAMRPDVEVLAVRGNVETRLSKATGSSAELDAVVLAMAGLIRSGLAEEHAAAIHPLAVEDFIPAAGQGSLVIQAARSGLDTELAAVLQEIGDAAAETALLAERAVLLALEADCHSCLAVHILPAEDQWRGLAMVARPDGSDMLRLQARQSTPDATAEALIEKLLAAGAKELI